MTSAAETRVNFAPPRCATVDRVNVAVLGLGLIGGSLVRALARHGHRVRGHDADPAARSLAQAAGAAPHGEHRWTVPGTVTATVADAELVVLAVPLPAVPPVLDELAAAGHAGPLTDVTSVKAPVRDLVAAHHPAARFVGGHPMAGRETSGFAAGDAGLFAGCAWVLCLEPGQTALPDWLALADLLTTIGARVVPSTADEHDRAVAAVSHVPHLLAAALAAGAAGNPLAGTLAAGSYRDGTRVAGTRPELMAAMCGGNAAAVRPALDAVRATLDTARAALDAPDPIGALRDWFAPGSAARTGWPAPPGTPTELPVGTDALLALGRAGGWITAVAADRRTVTAVRPARPDPAGSPAGR